ncbi:MAG: 30S ribosomal protein S16 [Candidatus Hydrogenedentota bacterium]|nr:MAG: 30S ribosomal protein S16 [Candidatus Hydrogenedentota bacterium]
MSVRIRLKRIGKKKQPVYRIVVADSKSPRDGKSIEILGTYDPGPKGGIRVKWDRTEHWLGKGAHPTETVKNLLRRARKTEAQEATA